MDDPTFWSLIASIDRRLVDEGDDEAGVQPLTTALAPQPVDRLEEFQEALAQKLFDLDAKIYADHAGDSGRSDDGFLYARCYAVAMGQQFYQAVLDDPARMPNTTEMWCEALLYAAQNAWSAKTDNDPADWPFEPSVSYESGSNEAGWDEE